MIIKSKGYRTVKSIRNLIEYITREQKLNNREQPFILTRFVRDSKNMESIIRQFESNEAKRIHKRKNCNIIYQEIISFHRGDTVFLDEAKLKQLARKYAKTRADKSMLLSSYHIDKEHLHLHLILSGLDFATGKSNRKSQKAFHRCKIEMENWQDQYLQLTHSRIDHNRKSRSQNKEKEFDLNKMDKIPNGEQLKEFAKISFLKTTTLDDWFRQLKLKEIEVYYRNGKATGLSLDGRKYRFKTLGISKEMIYKKQQYEIELDTKQKRMLSLEHLKKHQNMEQKKGKER